MSSSIDTTTEAHANTRPANAEELPDYAPVPQAAFGDDCAFPGAQLAQGFGQPAGAGLAVAHADNHFLGVRPLVRQEVLPVVCPGPTVSQHPSFLASDERRGKETAEADVQPRRCHGQVDSPGQARHRAEARILVRDTVRAFLELGCILRSPPVAQVAVGIELPPLVVKAVRQFVPDDGSDGEADSKARNGAGCRKGREWSPSYGNISGSQPSDGRD